MINIFKLIKVKIFGKSKFDVEKSELDKRLISNLKYFNKIEIVDEHGLEYSKKQFLDNIMIYLGDLVYLYEKNKKSSDKIMKFIKELKKQDDITSKFNVLYKSEFLPEDAKLFLSYPKSDYYNLIKIDKKGIPISNEKGFITEKKIDISNALRYLQLLGFIYPDPTGEEEILYDRYVNVWALFLEKGMIEKENAVDKILENIDCYILMLMYLLLKNGSLGLNRNDLADLGLNIRNNIKNIGKEQMESLESEMGKIMEYKETILKCILNSKLSDFDYRGDNDFDLLSNYYGFYNLKLEKKKKLVRSSLDECIEDVKNRNKIGKSKIHYSRIRTNKN